MTREEAVEILSDMRAEYNIFSDDEEEATRYHALSWAIQALNEQQRTERKRGKWKKWWEVKPDGFGGEVHIPHWACAECGTEYMPHLASAVHYCVNCGAQMEVENDE